MEKRSRPIAVADSGIGGISVLSELIGVMPNEDYIFFGDSANAPYGTKSRDEVRDIMLENTKTLLDMGAKAIVVACNTATSAAVKLMREKYPDIPIVGIEPALKLALNVCEHPTVAVMATPLTLAEEKFKSLRARFDSDEDIIELPCPGLMEIIESENVDGALVSEYIDNLFSPLAERKIDAVVLGCTHYSFIKNVVLDYFDRKIAVLDGALGTAREAKRRIVELGLDNQSKSHGSIHFVSSDNDSDKCVKYSQFLERYTKSR